MSTRHTVYKAPGRQLFTLVLLLWLLVFLGVALTWSALTLAATPDENSGATLVSTPDKCISLRKGQTCYQKITVRWTASRRGDYCLLHQGRERPLRCWQNATTGSARFEFVGKAKGLLELLDMASGQAVANTQIKLAWVYKERTKSKRSWRLF